MSDSDESSSISTGEEDDQASHRKRPAEFDFVDFRALSKRARLAEDLAHDFKSFVAPSGEIHRVFQVFRRIDAAAGALERKLLAARREPLWRLDVMFERQDGVVEDRRLAGEARAAARDLRRIVEDVIQRRPRDSLRQLGQQLDRARDEAMRKGRLKISEISDAIKPTEVNNSSS